MSQPSIRILLYQGCICRCVLFNPQKLSATQRAFQQTTDCGVLLGVGGDDDPYVLSYRGIDNETYYMLDGQNKSHLLNYSGCGNTTNANHPAVKDLIIESCRRYMHCCSAFAHSQH